jgi:hypothetical protein
MFEGEPMPQAIPTISPSFPQGTPYFDMFEGEKVLVVPQIVAETPTLVDTRKKV